MDKNLKTADSFSAKKIRRERRKEQTPEAQQDLLTGSLFMARSLLDSFEGDAALDIIRGVKRHNHGAAMNGSLQLLEELIENFDYRHAIMMIDILND